MSRKICIFPEKGAFFYESGSGGGFLRNRKEK